MDTTYQASLSSEVDWFIASYSFCESSSWLMHGKLIIIYTCFEKVSKSSWVFGGILRGFIHIPNSKENITI